jgi:hypothetical protein
MIRCALVLFALSTVTGCGEEPSSDRKASMAIPADWQSVEPLAGGEGRPRVSAALPPGLRKTGEVGIDSQMAAYQGAAVSVQFEHGAAAHPGCPAGVSKCVLSNAQIAGRLAKLSIAAAPVGALPFRTVYTFFVPFRQVDDRTGSSSGGAGLLLTVKCVAGPTCQDAERIGSTVRMSNEAGRSQ